VVDYLRRIFPNAQSDPTSRLRTILRRGDALCAGPKSFERLGAHPVGVRPLSQWTCRRNNTQALPQSLVRAISYVKAISADQADMTCGGHPPPRDLKLSVCSDFK
jgi:hypothetical protein